MKRARSVEQRVEAVVGRDQPITVHHVDEEAHHRIVASVGVRVAANWMIDAEARRDHRPVQPMAATFRTGNPAYVGHRGHAFRCIVITEVGDLSRSEAT